jgi:hypothetical protein
VTSRAVKDVVSDSSLQALTRNRARQQGRQIAILPVIARGIRQAVCLGDGFAGGLTAILPVRIER